MKIPYSITLPGDTYTLTGEGLFECHQIFTFDLDFKQHLEQNYEIKLTGSMPKQPGSILKMNLQMTGLQKGYYSDMPPEVPEIITDANPFQIDIDDTMTLKFSYVDEAY